MEGIERRYSRPGMIHLNSCGCMQAAVKKEPDRAMRKMAEGEPMPSSPSCSVVPTMTAIMISAYEADMIWATISCVTGDTATHHGQATHDDRTETDKGKTLLHI